MSICLGCSHCRQGRPGDTFLIRELLLKELKSQLDTNTYQNIAEVGTLVIQLLYTPGDKEVVPMLTQLLNLPVPGKVALLYYLNEKLNLTRYNDRFFNEVARERDPEFVALYDKLSLLQRIQYFLTGARSLDASDTLERDIKSNSLYLNLIDALNSHDRDVRNLGLELTAQLLESQIQGVLDEKALNACFRTSHDEIELRLQQRIKIALSISRVPMVDHFAVARKSYMDSMDKTVERLIGPKQPTALTFSLVDGFLRVRPPIVDISFVEKLILVLEVAVSKGFDLSPQAENLEAMSNIARAQADATLLRRFQILTFPLSSHGSCLGSVTDHKKIH